MSLLRKAPSGYWWLLPDQTNTADDPEVQLGLKVEAAHALWKLAAGNIKNCKLITDTGALLCFATLIENSGEELKSNSVMAVMEIAAAAESDSEFRRAAFANDSPSAKALVEQLLETITRENEEPELQVRCSCILYLQTGFSNWYFILCV